MSETMKFGRHITIVTQKKNINNRKPFSGKFSYYKIPLPKNLSETKQNQYEIQIESRVKNIYCTFNVHAVVYLFQ